jgi:hypothetical protein
MPTAINTRITNVMTAISASRRIFVVSLGAKAGGDHD